VLAANNIKAFIYPRLMPTPCLSFAVRKLGCTAGIMVTASHNPSYYNGYKVYGPDGCQITTEADCRILKEMEKVDLFDGIAAMDFERGLALGKIEYISEEIVDAFVEKVKEQSVAETGAPKNLAIIYSPLNGTGLEPVLRVLGESGYTNITVVEEQREPDGTFPTCPYPNPEVRQAMELGIEYARNCCGELVLATDPDCDRAGIAVRDKDGSYRLLSANETGVLLLDYLCSRRMAMGTMPKAPVLIKTIVTTRMAERIADDYGLQTVNVLTGFKFIGEQIGLLEAQGREDSYVFGFEESYGYLSGTYVRDKDGVGAALLICEMASYYKGKGLSLSDKLKELYERYGYFLDSQYSYRFEGRKGQARMGQIMADLRKGVDSFGTKRVTKCLDYQKGLEGLPKSDVLKFFLEDQAFVAVRPSGTEPKLKVYVSVMGETRTAAERMEKEIRSGLEAVFS